MQLARTSLYGLSALIYLADRPDSEPATVAIISQATGIPSEYLRKLLGRLLRGRLIRSVRGRNGGFLLDASRRSISLLQIVEAIEGPIDDATVFDDDLLNTLNRPVAKTLRLWRHQVAGKTRQMLAQTTLDKLSSKSHHATSTK